jgi:hypothetical protein
LKLIVDAKLLKRIAEAQRLNAAEIAKARGVRIGYMGHVMRITDCIQRLQMENCGLEEQQLAALRLHLQSEEWQDFVTRPYRDAKNINNRVLGGHKPQQTLGGGLSKQVTTQSSEDNTDTHVDMNTDQLARYIIKHLVADLPDKFSTEADGDALDDDYWAYQRLYFCQYVVVIFCFFASETGPDNTFELQGTEVCI